MAEEGVSVVPRNKIDAERGVLSESEEVFGELRTSLFAEYRRQHKREPVVVGEIPLCFSPPVEEKQSAS